MKACTLFLRAIGTMGEQIMGNMLKEKTRTDIIFDDILEQKINLCSF